MSTFTSPFKMSKTAVKQQERLEKQMVGMSHAERLSFILQYDANQAAKKRAAAIKRKMKRFRQGWFPRHAKKPTFSTADGSDYQRIKAFNSIVRYEGGFASAS